MMTEQVTIRVRPGELVRFPGRCVVCGQPGRDGLRLVKRRGQVTRRVDAPLCSECARQLSRRSGREEQFLRFSWPAAIVAGLLLTLIVFVAVPGGWPLRLVAAAIVGLAGGIFVRRMMTRRAMAEELPEKRAVREAVRIVDFDWRAMTLTFVNEAIAEQVRALNDVFDIVESEDNELAESEIESTPVG